MAITPTPPPSVSELPPAPNSATDTPSEFDAKANNFVSGQVTMVPQINAANDWVESTAQEVYGNALEAEASATNSADSAAESEESAILAQNASKLLGEWSTLTGAVNIGETVINNGGKWQAITDISDVTASEPTLSNSDWLLINASGKAVPIADALTLNPNVINQISATQSNPLPLAASVPANTVLYVSVDDTSKNIVTTHLASGADTTTDSKGTLPSVDDPVAGFIINWSSGGLIRFTSNGLNNWRY